MKKDTGKGLIRTHNQVYPVFVCSPNLNIGEMERGRDELQGHRLRMLALSKKTRPPSAAPTGLSTKN